MNFMLGQSVHIIAILLIGGLALLHSEEVALGFEFKSISYPGGLSMHVNWNSETKVLVYRKASDFKSLPLSEKAKDEDTYLVDEKSSLYYELCSISKLLHDIPNQNDLPSDGVTVFDGIGYQITTKTTSRNIAKEYNNPDNHNRLMDMAFSGICHRVVDLKRMYGSLMVKGN